MNDTLLDVRGRRVCLIGGAGFIGHNLALELKRRGADVTVIDGLQVNNLVAITANVDGLPLRDLYLHMISDRLRLLREAEIPLHVLDARDYQALSFTLGDIKPQVVIQLAAVAHADRANKNPYTTFDHSLRTLENALDCARDQVEHFIYFSSSMVYGNFTSGTVTEETPCEPLGIYGALKFGGEKLVIAYGQVFDLPYTIIRPSALYGERCVSRRVGQSFIEAALLGEPLHIVGDGSHRLDFTYIDDLVAGVVATIERPASRGEVFNLTHGGSRSVAELLALVREEFPDVEVVHKEVDRLTPDRGTLSIDKARSILEFEPQWSLEQGMSSYMAWYRDLVTTTPRLMAQD